MKVYAIAIPRGALCRALPSLFAYWVLTDLEWPRHTRETLVAVSAVKVWLRDYSVLADGIQAKAPVLHRALTDELIIMAIKEPEAFSAALTALLPRPSKPPTRKSFLSPTAVCAKLLPAAIGCRSRPAGIPPDVKAGGAFYQIAIRARARL